MHLYKSQVPQRGEVHPAALRGVLGVLNFSPSLQGGDTYTSQRGPILSIPNI